MEKSIRDDILDFIKELPYWQKYLSAFLIGALADPNKEEVIRKAALYFLSEQGLLKEPLDQEDLVIPAVTKQDQKSNSEVGRLVSVSNLKNIAALCENQTLPINEVGITAIFGVTGVGKSSYARVMNHAFVSRGDVSVIGNVFDPIRSGPPEATFTFKKDNGEEYKLSYPNQITSSEFYQYATFDSAAVRVHIDSNNELHVTPRGLNFFENLADLVLASSRNIQDMIDEIRKENVFPRHFSVNSDIKTLMNVLGAKSKIDTIRKLGDFTEEDAKLLNDAERESAKLKINDLVEKKKLNQTIANEIEDIKLNLEQMASVFSKKNLKKAQSRVEHRAALLIELKNSGIEKFNDSRFRGIGSDTWKTFIRSGKDFSDLQENSLEKGDPCPYCRQDLTLVASKLIKDYDIYLKSEAEKELKECNAGISKLIQSLQSLTLLNLESKPKTMAWLCERKIVIKNTIKEALIYYSQLKDTLIKNLEKKTWTELELRFFEIDWATLNEALGEEKEMLNSDEIEKKKNKLDVKIINLEHKKILHGLIPEIEMFINNMVWVKKCEDAKKNIRTNTITRTSRKLYESHVTELYRETFKAECLELNVGTPELKQVGKFGKTKRRYIVGDVTPSNVLSDGEQRAVALADFFTEIKVSKINSGWVFDDPVASQDHERKERIAQKLASEARSRQIIVFTHDLAFFSDLVNAAVENGVPIIQHSIDSHGINNVGIVHANCKIDFESSYVKPTLAKNYLSKAKSAGNPREKRLFLQSGFSSLRTSYEAFFVAKVLDGVVTRFNRRIKYHAIDKIYAPKKYLDQISRKLKYLSRNILAHLQADNDASVITFDMLEQEINKYQDMYDCYKREKRQTEQQG